MLFFSKRECFLCSKGILMRYVFKSKALIKLSSFFLMFLFLHSYLKETKSSQTTQETLLDSSLVKSFVY